MVRVGESLDSYEQDLTLRCLVTEYNRVTLRWFIQVRITGSDIHVCVDYFKTPKGAARRREAKSNGPIRGCPVIVDSFRIPRNYRLFAALAGVRNIEGHSIRFQPRGLPDDCDYTIRSKFYMEVFSRETPVEQYRGGYKWCYQDEAESLCDRYGLEVETYDLIRLIRDPDLHTPGFLQLNEIDQALKHAEYDVSEASYEFRLIRDIMCSLDDQYGKQCSRLIFWFDG